MPLTWDLRPAGPKRHVLQAGGGRDRYAFFAFPHVGIQEDGTLGKVRRPGQGEASAACGALVASLGALQEGGLQPLQMADGSALLSETPEHHSTAQRCDSAAPDRTALGAACIPFCSRMPSAMQAVP